MAPTAGREWGPECSEGRWHLKVADALTKHLGKGPLSSHMQSVRFEIRDGRHPLCHLVTALTKRKSVMQCHLKAKSAFCQVALACKFVRVKGLGPERGSLSAHRRFDLCCIDCTHTN